MKRCPQCKFIYLDTDEFCDLDGMALASVDDAEMATVGSDASAAKKAEVAPGRDSAQVARPIRRGINLALMAIAGLAIGVVLILVYYGVSRKVAPAAREQNSNQSTSKLTVTQPVTPALPATPSPVPSNSVSVETPIPIAGSSASPLTAATRALVSSSPVSTSGEKTKTGPVTIRLTNGARVEADEAWRTKEGIWYRRKGMVTLLKSSRVKTIDKAKASEKSSPASSKALSPKAPKPSESQPPR